jgi:predicted HD phosphohydrolase
MPIRTMESATKADWGGFVDEIRDLRHAQAARIKRTLLSLSELDVGAFAVNQLTHCLQTATYADRAGAKEEIVLAALLHDAGKIISPNNHGPIIAETLKPVVSEGTYWLVQTHQDFQGRYFYDHIGRDPNTFKKYEQHPMFELALQFSAWDQAAFDPAYDTLPFSHFEHLIDQFWAPKNGK